MHRAGLSGRPRRTSRRGPSTRGTVAARRRRRARASVLTGATVALATLGGIGLASSVDAGSPPAGHVAPAMEGAVRPAPLPPATGDDGRESEIRTVSTAQSANAAPAPQAAHDVVGAWETTASWYGPGFAGNLTANGETFDPAELTAAHEVLPFGSRVRVTALATGRSVVVRINDRGPYIEGRGIDLSRAAAEAIGLRGPGVGRVRIELLDA